MCKDLTHFELLIACLVIWLIYSTIRSIDCHKILHRFRFRKRRQVDPDTVKEIKEYWSDAVKTGIKTFTKELPLNPVPKQELEKLLTKLSEVIYKFYRLIPHF